MDQGLDGNLGSFLTLGESFLNKAVVFGLLKLICLN
jgi:hypothetical protein